MARIVDTLAKPVRCVKRLVIFPMSGNNTFETSDFADPHFSIRNNDGGQFSSTRFLWKKYCETWNK